MFAVVGMVRDVEERTGKPFDWEAYSNSGRHHAYPVNTGRELASQLDLSETIVFFATQVLREAPDIAERVMAGYNAKWVKTNGQAFDWEGYAKPTFGAGHPMDDQQEMPTGKATAEQIGVGENTFWKAMQILRYAPTAAKKVMAGGSVANVFSFRVRESCMSFYDFRLSLQKLLQTCVVLSVLCGTLPWKDEKMPRSFNEFQQFVLGSGSFELSMW